MFCAVCSRFLSARPPATCPECGAVTDYTLTDAARQWIAERTAAAERFDDTWLHLGPEERKRARQKAQEHLARKR
jgi:hypothetical protein